jgi:hypothetical protein
VSLLWKAPPRVASFWAPTAADSRKLLDPPEPSFAAVTLSVWLHN